MFIPSGLQVVAGSRIARVRLAPAVVSLSLAAIALGWPPAAARADLILQIENTVATAGGTGAFDVLLVDTGGTFNVSGFSFGLSVDAGSGINFTGADTNTTTAPYLFGTLQNPPLSYTMFPSTSLIAADADNTSPYYVALTTGSTFGLGDISYSVAAGTSSGPVAISLNPDPSVTQIDDAAGNPLPITLVNGTITVSAVPEPSTLTMAAIGVGMALIAAHFRRSKI